MNLSIEHGAIVEHYDNFKIHEVSKNKIVFKMYGKLKTYRFKKAEPFSLAAVIHKAGLDFVKESAEHGANEVVDKVKSALGKIFG
jgi:hypothetical protein